MLPLGRYGNGCKRDPHDPRDRPLGALLQTVEEPPYAWNANSPLVLPKNQLRTGTCVGQGTAQAARLSYLAQGIDCPELSASFLYRGALNVDPSTRSLVGDEAAQAGTNVRNAVRVLQRIGAAAESVRPFSESRCVDPITLDDLRSGGDRWGIRGYYRIFQGDVVGVKRAIWKGFIPVGGWEISEAFERWDSRDPIDVLTDAIVGGHCMPVTAYEGNVFDLLNSWGKGAGRNGHWFVTDRFIANAFDMWALDIRKTS